MVISAKATTHGGSKFPEYLVWRAMIDRCHRASSREFRLYGERGITVCGEWRESFAAFIRDMGRRPRGVSVNGRALYTLERIDNNGPYSASNCRWATQREQGANTQRNRVLTLRGRRKPLVVWARGAGLPYSAVHQRLRRGWTLDRALTEPLHGFPNSAARKSLS